MTLLEMLKKQGIKPIRFTSYTTQPKNRIVTTDEDIKALRDYLFHKEKLSKMHSSVRITFP